MDGGISGGFCRRVDVMVDIFQLCGVHLDLHAAEHIDHICHDLEVYRDEVLNVQIQTGIQHTDRLLRAADGKGTVRLMEVR